MLEVCRGGYLIEPYIASKSIQQDANCIKSIVLNTNCILTSANTNITVRSVENNYSVPSSSSSDYSISNVEITKSSIDVTLGANNTIVIKTGPKTSVSFDVSTRDGSSSYTNYFFSTSTITLTYSKNGITCSGTITVIH